MKTRQDHAFGRWPDILIACLLIALAISAVRAYVGIFYAGQQLDSMLVWSASDAPNFRTPGSSAIPIWGVHYFGDLQEVFTWTKAVFSGVNPYDFLANYPPFAFLVTIPIVWMEPKLAVPLVIAACGLALIAVGWRMGAGLKTTQRITSVILCMVLTSPFLGLLDRGNLTILIAVLVGLYLLMWSKARGAGLVLGVAIAIKVFPIVLLALAVADRRRREVVAALATALSLSAIAILLIPGPLSNAASGFVSGIAQSASEGSSAYNYSTLGLFQQIEVLIFNGRLTGAYPVSAPLLVILAAIIWIVATAWLLRSKKLPSWLLGLIVLASMQLVPPSSNVYSCFGAMFAAIWFVRPGNFPSIGSDKPGSELRTLRITAIAYLVTTLTPIGLHIRFGEVDFGVSAFLSPCAAWTILAVAIGRNIVLIRNSHADLSRDSPSTTERS